MRIALWLAVLGLMASADTVVLKNGLRVRGEVTRQKDKVIVTLGDRTRTFDASQVRRVEEGRTPLEEYVKRADALADGTAADWYRLALWAKAKLPKKAPDAFEQVLRLDSDHRAARRELGYERVDNEWVSKRDAMKKKGFVLAGGRWLLPAEADKLMRKGLIEAAKVTDDHRRQADEIVTALMDANKSVRQAAAELLDEVPPAALLRPLKKALRCRHEDTRLLAVRTLGRIGDKVALPWLIESSLIDGSTKVRATALRQVKGFGDADVFFPYARALWSPWRRIRMEAAKVLGDLDDLRGADVVMRRYRWGLGASPRVNVYFGKQQSYVQDFDVEIAQAAAIGDPIINSIRDGVILDFKVMGGTGDGWVLERASYVDALQKITGQDYGDDVKAYQKYMEEEEYPRVKITQK